jgi:peptidoglycan/xylan/chitin deacetylase (PgdA/CDA1 family)
MQRQARHAVAALVVLAAAALTLIAGSATAWASTGSVSTGSVSTGVASAGPATPTVVSFTWGGGLGDQMGALPIFQRYRMHATFYVPSGLVCQPGTSPGCTQSPYLTLDEVRRIAAGGNEIGGLSVQHVPLAGLPVAEAQREICDDRVNLTRWGFHVTDFAYPFAQVNPTLQDLARRCGYNSALGTGQLRGAGLCPHCAWAETIPPRNPYLLRAPIEVASVGTRWSPATFEKIVTGARQHGGGWIIFTIHDVCAQACALGVTRPELSSVLGWLSRQAGHGVSVRTVRQVIGGPVRPAVAGPDPRPVPPPGVVNSRLSAVTAAGMPACFQAGRFGANHATFRYQPRAGPGGAGAEAISLTQRKSGTAQIVPAMDLGACAPAAAAGHRYALGAWYKSSGPVVFNTYYRTAAGTWAFWVTSPPLAASRSWTQGRWTSPAVPSGATAVSFGVALRADGTLATSRYSLAPVRYTSTRLIAFVVLVLAAVIALFGVRRFRRPLIPPPGDRGQEPPRGRPNRRRP